MLQKEEALREVSEIVGAEGLQDADRLLMLVADRIRTGFLSQNAYGEDAFSPPERTFEAISDIMQFYDRVLKRIARGQSLDEALTEEGRT